MIKNIVEGIQNFEVSKPLSRAKSRIRQLKN